MATRRFKFTEVAPAGVAEASMRIPANSIVRVHPSVSAFWTGSTAELRVVCGSEVLVDDEDITSGGGYALTSNGFDDTAAADKVGTIDAATTLTITVTKTGTTGTAGRGEVLVETTSVREIDVPQVDS